MNPIYLDHNATTPVRPEVIEAMARCSRDGLANPAARHQLGQKARRVLEDARERIAELLGAAVVGHRAERLIFTSGGTEANNLAVLGIPQAAGDDQPVHVIVSGVEHASVLEPASRLMDAGRHVDLLPTSPDGTVRADRLPSLLRPETKLVCVMLGNHETGVLQPVASLAAVCREAGVPLHTDAAQVAGKLPIHFRRLDVGSLSLAAHKLGGPPGIGVLLLRHDVAVEPILFGGPQQGGLRPGTESVALAVGLRTALELWADASQAYAERLQSLRDRFEQRLLAGRPGLIIHGRSADRVPQTSCVAFPGLDAQVLLIALDMAGVACSVGSACSSGSAELSPTLLAMGVSQEVAAASLRFSLGHTTSQDEIDDATQRILSVVENMPR